MVLFNHTFRKRERTKDIMEKQTRGEQKISWRSRLGVRRYHGEAD